MNGVQTVVTAQDDGLLRSIEHEVMQPMWDRVHDLHVELKWIMLVAETWL